VAFDILILFRRISANIQQGGIGYRKRDESKRLLKGYGGYRSFINDKR
jgi:hypothetical protein